MKKFALIIVSFLLITLGLNAQQSINNPFTGKTFIINKHLNNQVQIAEELSFEQGLLESSVYSKKGFVKTEYRAAKNDKTGIWEFSCTMTNTQNEKVIWHGTNNLGAIEGNCIWSKGEQSSVHYSFKGKVK